MEPNSPLLPKCHVSHVIFSVIVVVSGSASSGLMEEGGNESDKFYDIKVPIHGNPPKRILSKFPSHTYNNKIDIAVIQSNSFGL